MTAADRAKACAPRNKGEGHHYYGCLCPGCEDRRRLIDAIRDQIEAAERAARDEEREKAVAGRLAWRGIETACSVCGGAGRRVYGNTSTWRGGMGGSSMTNDVCSHCWGSGDEHRHFSDQRRLERAARGVNPDAERAAFEAGYRAAYRGDSRMPQNMFDVQLADALKRFTEAGK